MKTQTKPKLEADVEKRWIAFRHKHFTMHSNLWLHDRETSLQLFESFLAAEIELATEEKREEITNIVSIEIEAWFGAHDEMERKFWSEDMIKHITKRIKTYDK